MRKFLWVIAVLLFAPCAKADTLDFIVTSGVIPIPGGTMDVSGVTSSGDAFTATGNFSILTCPYDFRPGQPITACPSAYFNALVTVTGVQGIDSVVLGEDFDFGINIATAPIYLSGPTQATLTEPATVAPLLGCYGLVSIPDPFGGGTELVPCWTQNAINVAFVLPSVEWTVNLVAADPSTFSPPVAGGYTVTSEYLTISAPEAGTRSLTLVGVGLLGLMMVLRKRMARGHPQAT